MVKYQIFISSTYDDLKPERDQVIKAVLEMGHIPVGMEMFSAADKQQWEIIKKQIEQSDYYIVLVAHRYGSMDGDVSYTEKEYDYAINQKVPVLGFILDNSVTWPEKWIENNNDIKKRLENFKAKVTSRMVSFWKSSEDLYGKCGIALMKAFAAQPREGWVKASEVQTSEMTAEITRLSRENGSLRAQLISVSAAEIEGQKAKVNEIIDAMRRNNRKIYVWLDGDSNWGNAKETNLLAIFEAIAPDLLDEALNETLANSLGLRFASPPGPRHTWPIPQNFVKAYLADFISLDLVSNSTKRHSVSDTRAYWMLTDFGRQVHGNIRKNDLLKGLVRFEEKPADESDES